MFYGKRAHGHQDGSFSLRAVPARSESPRGRKRHVSSSLCPLQEFQQELKHTYWILIMEASYLNHYINEAGRELEPQKYNKTLEQEGTIHVLSFCICDLYVWVIQMEKS